jgi:hypothetical protein|tara:strand:+ start:65 stop:196 length:132 start_codon:yes stop_codon:yes gene_type:complete
MKIAGFWLWLHACHERSLTRIDQVLRGFQALKPAQKRHEKWHL